MKTISVVIAFLSAEQSAADTTQFDATKARTSGFQAPFTLSEGLDRTIKYEFLVI